jgi:hypothetical protein
MPTPTPTPTPNSEMRINQMPQHLHRCPASVVSRSKRLAADTFDALKKRKKMSKTSETSETYNDNAHEHDTSLFLLPVSKPK